MAVPYFEKFTDTAISASKNSTVKRLAYGLAAIAFAVGLFFSYRAMPNFIDRMNWVPFLVVLLIGIPLTQILNAVEIILTGRLIGRGFRFSEAIRISIIGGAANMLPLPGGTLVRVAALKGRGAKIGEGVRVTIAVGVIWIGVAFCFSAIWMASFARLLGVFLGVVGVLALGIGIWLGLKQYKRHSVVAQIVALKLVATVLECVRLMLCFWAIGEMVSFAVAASLAAASVTGAAISIVPAGLGIREGLSALLVSFTGMSAATGFLAAALNRLAGLSALFPAALVLSCLENGKQADE